MEKHEPVAFSPKEFAGLFNKEQSWGYRQIYAGKVSTITEYGRVLIPASEVEKILGSAGRYEGQKKLMRTKKQLEQLKPELQSAWTSFVRSKKLQQAEAPSETTKKQSSKVDGIEQRRAAFKRLSKR